MKIYAISDLHLSFIADKPMDLFGGHWTNYEERILSDWNSKVGADDVGIIAGDISWAMRMEETAKDFEFLKKLNGHKIIIRGNHDYWWKSISRIRSELGADFSVLQNDSVKIGNTIFAGTRGWRVPERRQGQNDEDKKIYAREVQRLELALKDVEKKRQEGDKLIAVIHYPPFNSTRDNSQFTELMEQYKVDVCVYGHLHGKPGRAELITQKNGIKYYLTSCDILDFKVTEINLDKA
ncbi:MAG: metallophosphoesterase [Firmicutes bacterium]|nr:metallophosphoesterase [Bacillota bacterium]